MALFRIWVQGLRSEERRDDLAADCDDIRAVAAPVPSALLFTRDQGPRAVIREQLQKHCVRNPSVEYDSAFYTSRHCGSRGSCLWDHSASDRAIGD